VFFNINAQLELLFLAFLRFIERDLGRASSALMLDTSGGSFVNYSKTTTEALVARKDTTIIWLGETERKEISEAIHASYGLPNCC